MTVRNQLNPSRFLHFVIGLEGRWLRININLKKEKKRKSLAKPLHRILAVIQIDKYKSLSRTDTLISNTNQFVILELNV